MIHMITGARYGAALGLDVTLPIAYRNDTAS